MLCNVILIITDILEVISTMIYIAICEDNAVYGFSIKEMINRLLDEKAIEHTIDLFLSGTELLKSDSCFDIVFLDIKMSPISGLETASLLRKKHPDFILIFITSYEEYIYEAFDVEAFNYILKPVDESRISAVLQHAVAKLDSNTESYIIISKNRQVIKVDLMQVIYFEVLGRIINIHFVDHVIEFYERISSLEHKIPQSSFFRCHNSYIINMKYITRFTKNEVIMDNLDVVPISKRRYDEFSKAVLNYMKKEGGII